jgi:uncharacterized protein (DUF779 family)
MHLLPRLHPLQRLLLMPALPSKHCYVCLHQASAGCKDPKPRCRVAFLLGIRHVLVCDLECLAFTE